jgi:hypothetical protein
MRLSAGHAAFVAFLLGWASPAEARVGRTLAESVAAARAAKVVSATFAVRSGIVVMEHWRSYPGDDHRRGPHWTRPQADAMRRALAGGRAPVREAVEPVAWASFAVPTFRYADGTTIRLVAKPDATRVWMLVAGGDWAWKTPWQEVEAACEAWTLVKGKLARRATLAP